MWPRSEIWEWCLRNSMLLRVLAIVVPPMQTRVVRLLVVPVLHDIYLAVAWPVERFAWQHPVRRPDTRGARWESSGFEIAARA